MGDLKFVDTMIKDGLMDAFNGYHMGKTAENVAAKWQITREEQDRFAVALAKQGRGGAKSRPIQGRDRAGHHQTRKGDIVVDTDEYIRAATTLESLAKLEPGLSKDGTVTAGNASGINDGAAALVLMSADEANARGLTPMARIASWATAGVDPAIMGTGPIPAIPQGAGKGRLEGQGPRSRGSQRSLRRPGAARSTRTWAGTRRSSTSTAAPSRSAIRSALPARAS